MLIAVGGFVASGKSSVARELARTLGAVHIEADQVRDEILQIPSSQAAHEAAWSDNLAPGVTDRIYSEMLDRAESALSKDRPAVLDGCFATHAQRVGARGLAHLYANPFLFVECRTTRSVLEQRLRDRSRATGIDESAWFPLLDRIESRWEPVTELAVDEYVKVDSELAVPMIVDDVMAHTRRGLPLAGSA